MLLFGVSSTNSVQRSDHRKGATAHELYVPDIDQASMATAIGFSILGCGYLNSRFATYPVGQAAMKEWTDLRRRIESSW